MITIEEKKKKVNAALPDVLVIGESIKKKYLKCFCEIHNHYWEGYYYNLIKGSGCPKCKGDKIGKKHRIKIDEVLKEYRKRGLKPLFTEYRNSQEKLLCENNDGYKVVICLSHLKNGRIPSVFGNGNPFTIENIKLFLSRNTENYKLLSSEFKNANNDKLSLKCEKDHVFEMTWSSILKGTRCNVCYGNKLKTTDIFKEEVKKLVGKEYSILGEYKRDNNHIEIKHELCGHQYKVTPSHFLRGRRCPKCALRYGEKNNKYNASLSDEDRAKRRIVAGENIVKWRISVFERDNFTCYCCNKKGGKLNAHHLNGYHWFKEGRFDINNGVTLCKVCHLDFHNKYGRRNNTKEQFYEYIENKLKGGENID